MTGMEDAPIITCR